MSRRSANCRLYVAVIALCVCSIAFARFPHSSEGPQSSFAADHAPPEAGYQAGRQGYLLMMEVQADQTRWVSVAEIDNYFESKHLAADDDWFVLLFNNAGECIGTEIISNPAHYSPILFSDQPLPFVVKIPRMNGLAEMVIFDQHRVERLRLAIDNLFRMKAAANRQQFLAHDRENRRLLMEEARMLQPGALAAVQEEHEVLRFESMPEDLQKHIRGEIALEMERLEEFGAELLNLRKGVPLEPEEMQSALRRVARDVVRPAAAAEAFSAAGLYGLSGQVTDLDTRAPLEGASLDFYQYDASSQYKGYIGRQTTDASGNYSVSVDAGIVRILPDYSRLAPKRYVVRSESAAIAANTTWNFKAIPGVLLSGTVTNAQNLGVSGANVQTYAKDLQLYVNASSSGTGSYSAVVPNNRPLNISVSPPTPFVPPPAEIGIILSADTIRNFRIETGWIVTGTVSGEGGAPVARASVLLRQLTPTTTGSPNWYGNTDNNGKYTFAVPKNLVPNSLILVAYAQNYALQSVALEITRDMTRDLRLIRGNTVSGTVWDSSEAPVRGVRVRAYLNGMLLNSALTNTDGTYAFDLPSGNYELEALPPSGSALEPLIVKNVSVDQARQVGFVLSPAAGVLTVNLYFPSEDMYNRFSNRALVRFELYQSGRTVHASSGVQVVGGFDQTRGKYFRPYNLYLNKGKYTLVSYAAGCQPISLPNLDVSGAIAASLDLPAPFLWTGVLRGADGAPLANLSIQSYTDLARENEWTYTNASGQFSVFLTPNGFVKFYTNTRSNNILHTERFGNVTAGRNLDVVLDAFPPFADSGSTLTQIYGDPDRRSRWNIVTIGDGYTNIRETYTDLNGNGQWDGVLYYDLNKNGAWDTGEPYQRYGNASAPTAGSDPAQKNEPFTDLNGDGVPNQDDQAFYDQNTLDTARSLFGQDEWRRHRDAFNIFRIRLVSKQAGHKIYDINGKVVIDRDTALGTYLNTPERSYLFNANYTLVTQYINQYVPECDTRIVMVNQPVRMGRVNSYMFQYGGDMPSLGNDYVVAHEMGHNVGLLADEYTEYQETYRGPESAARNITSVPDPRCIPWLQLIAPGKEIPSVPGSSGVGLYEGAGYYTGGRYRPTEFCMMVSGNRYCPVCTEEIEVRLRDITAVVPDAKPRAPVSIVASLYPEFGWESQEGVSHYVLEVEKADGSQLVASYDVYHTAFILPFALTGNTEYRWRIRPASAGRYGAWSSWVYFKPQSPTPMFTGVFAQIAAGGGYQTTLTSINTGQTTADVTVTLARSDGSAFDPIGSATAEPAHFNIKPMGGARLQAALPGDTVAGFARLGSNIPIDGTALFKMVRNDLVVSEAGVGLSKPGKNFMIYIDNLGDALSGYAVANFGANPAGLTMTLRDASGTTRETKNFNLPAGRHFAEFAYQRFTAASVGFEGSIEFASDQNLAAVALRYDNAAKDVFSTIPVLVDEPGTIFYFPQVADGEGYRTNFMLLNPSGTPTSAKLEFLSSQGLPLALPIGGVSKTSHDVPLSAKGAARFFTDGTSGSVSVGWVKVTSPVAVIGSSIFQSRAGDRILSEAGVAPSPLTQHFVTYVESLGSTESGVAICNPNATAVTLTLNLCRSTGEVAATTSFDLPAKGQLAKFFTEWFLRGFGEFEGTLEVRASAPVSAVALRYDNPRQDVYATLPVIVLP